MIQKMQLSFSLQEF